MRIVYHSKFIIHKEANGNFTIRLRFNLRSQSPFDLSVGYTLRHKDDWDGSRQRLRSKAADASIINRALGSIEQSIADMMTRYEVIEHTIPSRDKLHDDISLILGRGYTERQSEQLDNDDLFFVFDLYCQKKDIQNQWTKETKKHFISLRNHLERYCPTLRFSELSEDSLQGFIAYLTQSRHKNTYITRLVSQVRFFLRWSAQHGFYHGSLHETFKPRLRGSNYEYKEIIYLTIDELQRMERYDFSTAMRHLECVRDVFIFCCYSGLRISDAAKLTTDDVHAEYIDVVTKKTNERLRIELNSHTKTILNRYKGVCPGNRALPTLSNQKTNVHLKEIGRMCGLNEPIRLVSYIGNTRHEEVVCKWQVLSTHCARRTFVITALQLGIPAEVIMKWTGHSDYKAMKPYIKIVDKLKEQSMKRFDAIQ